MQRPALWPCPAVRLPGRKFYACSVAKDAVSRIPGPVPGGQRTFAYNILQFTPCGVYSSLLAARRRLTTRHRHSPGPLPARRFLARVGLQPIGVGTARHGGHAPRRRLLRLPLGASLAGPGGGCGPGPSTPGPPTLSLSLVGGSSQLPALGREVNGHSHRIFCSLHLAWHI